MCHFESVMELSTAKPLLPVFFIGQVLSVQQVCIREEEKASCLGHRRLRCACIICSICLLPPPSILHPPSILKEKGKHKNCFHRAQHLRQVHFLQFSWAKISLHISLFIKLSPEREQYRRKKKSHPPTLEIEGKCVLNEKEESTDPFLWF